MKSQNFIQFFQCSKFDSIWSPIDRRELKKGKIGIHIQPAEKMVYIVEFLIISPTTTFGEVAKETAQEKNETPRRRTVTKAARGENGFYLLPASNKYKFDPSRAHLFMCIQKRVCMYEKHTCD